MIDELDEVLEGYYLEPVTCGVRAWPWRMNTNSVEPTANVY